MDAPIASLMVKYFSVGYVTQVEKEEKEAKGIVNTIDSNALKALCTRYDNKIGEYPEHEHEGAAVYAFFEKMRDNVEKGKKKMNDVETIEEAIEAKMRAIEAYKGIKRPNSYFMLGRFLKHYANLCWQRGVKHHNGQNLRPINGGKENE